MLDSISKIEKCVNQIADGDLTSNVQIKSNDEMKNIGEDINKMVENLNEYRKTLKGNFEEKVQKMNEITEALKNKE